jgi:16S rRNA (cytidine1402-2'-O)-methyltransferase
LFESGPRLAESLADMAEAFGARAGVVARELTKMFEEVRRAPLDELAAHYGQAGAPKGEIVVLIAPPPEPAEASADELDAFLRAALTRMSVKEAASEAAEKLNVQRRTAYARALEIKDE